MPLIEVLFARLKVEVPLGDLLAEVLRFAVVNEPVADVADVRSSANRVGPDRS